MMRLLADENLSRAAVEKLRGAGFDVASIMEDARGAADVEVLRIAMEQETSPRHAGP